MHPHAPSPLKSRGRQGIGWILAAAFLFSGCSHFRRGNGYRGAGDFKTSSEYATPSNPTPPSAPPSPGYNPQRDFKLYWPVTNIRINRGFAQKPRGRPHQGLDLGGSKGTPILAAHEGVVIYAGRDFRGFGNMVLVEYNKEWATLYGHLSRIEVKEGRIVLPGDEIGKMGRTGRATGVHLHFELMRNRQPIDPIPFLTRSGQLAGR